MKHFRYQICFLLCGLALLLCGCPQQESNDRPARGRWAGNDAAGGNDAASSQDDSAAADEESAGADSSGSDSAADDPAADDEDSASEEAADDTGSADEASDDSAEDSEADEEDAEAGEEDSAEDEAAEDAEPAPADDSASSSSLDLSGEWLPLFGRNRQGVKPEMWKDGKLYTMSGDQRKLTVSPISSSAFGAEAAGEYTNVRISRNGPFLVIDVGSDGSIAYLNTDGLATDIAAEGNMSAKVAGKQLAATFRSNGNSLRIDFADGGSFDGKLSSGAWCGFLEAGGKRGYCVLAMTGNSGLTGILFVDPYVSFVNGLSFEIVQ